MSGENLWGDDTSDDEVEEVESEVVEVENEEDESDELPVPDDENSLVQPVEDIDQVVQVYQQFEEIKDKLLESEDLTKIGDNVHVNKSGWRKIATAFNLSIETTDKQRVIEDGIVKYIVTARAVAPNGKSTTGSGLCSSSESNYMRKLVDEDGGREEAEKRADNPQDVLLVDGWYRELKSPAEVNEHNIMATAETRAKNRAISDLVGGGEVSTEELAQKNKEEILE